MPEVKTSRPPGTYTRQSTVRLSASQSWASLFAAGLLLLAGVLTLREFIPALVWAVVIAVAVWPLFDRAGKRWPRHRRGLLPALVVLAILVVFAIPLTLVAVPLAQDAHGAADFINKVRQQGLPAPPILGQLPWGRRLVALWQANIGQPGQLDVYESHLAQGGLAGFGRHVAREAAHRAVLFGFTLLTVFLLLREADAVVGQVKVASRRAFGPAGEQVGRQVIRSVHGTVNGLVLVGLAEGVILTVFYLAVGAPHAALLGLLTTLLAMVPFGGAIAVGASALVLLAVNKVVGAVVVAVLGSLVVFVADHLFRPVLIGGAVKLPFLWVLLGILGGATTFGLLGLFVGPAIMAALILLWREWTGSEQGPLNPTPDESST